MNREIVESFAEMARQKGMDKDVLAGIIEDIFGLLVKKKYGEEARYDVVVNMDRGDIEIYLEREIVEALKKLTAKETKTNLKSGKITLKKLSLFHLEED